KQLRGGDSHPLVERIMRIHVTEEARHISFARQYVRQQVPQLGPVRQSILGIAAPLLLGVMTPMMVNPPRDLRLSGVPAKVLRQAARSANARQLRKDSVAKLRRLCVDLGLAGRPARW